MLPQRQRLSAEEVRRTLKRPGRVAGACFTCSWQARSRGGWRCAVVLGRHGGGAVERNRLRRVFYAALQDSLPKEDNGIAVDAVFFLRYPPPKQPFATYRSELQDVVSRITRTVREKSFPSRDAPATVTT